jgi:ribosome-binding factor A
MRAQVGRRIKLRRVPALNFVLDETLDNSERLDALLEETGDLEDE